MCGKIFLIYLFYIPRKRIESMHFSSYPSPPLKSPGRICWKSFSTKMKGVEETGLRYQNSIRKYEDNLKH